MECAGLIGRSFFSLIIMICLCIAIAVGRDMFRPDANALVELMRI